MSTKSQAATPGPLCINAEKVYDWILGESTGSTLIDIGDLPTQIPAGAINVEVNCILTDASGTPLPLNIEIDIDEVAPREDRNFEVNGEPVILQRVILSKTIHAVLEIRGVDPATGTQFLITSDPIPFNFIEIAHLCAPVGTSLVVRITDFSGLTVINRDVGDEITGFVLQLFICKSIQTISPVTVEIDAGSTMPREVLAEQCINPAIPPQCPTIFPGV